MTSTMAMEYLFAAATQAPDRLIIAKSLTHVALSSSPRWQQRATKVRGSGAALRRSVSPRHQAVKRAPAVV